MTEGAQPGPDVIELLGLRLSGRCGVLPEEIDRAQPLEVDLLIETDTSEAGRTDELTATVDYGAVCDRVERIVTTGRVGLLERLAALIAAEVLELERVDGVTVTVRKLRPPVPQLLTSSGVTIRRTSGSTR